MLERGVQLGPYVVRSSLAKGGMGEVYLAVDERLDRQVAIKVIPENLARDPAAIARFQSEAKTLAALSHPNIITIFDVGSHDGIYFVVMELLKGATLRELLLGGPLTLPKTLEISIPISEALSAAHGIHISHRDIKPENIFVTSEGQVKLLDFGLAMSEERETDENLPFVPTRSVLTEPGVVFGSLPYMSPEQVTGKIVDERTDIFSFGALLYEMLTGTRPFGAPTQSELIASILRDEPVLKAALPMDLQFIINRCLQKDPGKRFQKAADLHAALLHVSRRSIMRRGADDQEFSVAVLYFENLSPSPDNEYIRDGMTEDVITELSKIQKIKVFSRSAVLPFRDKPITAVEIAGRLSASHVLEGSIRRAEARLRITARLVDAETGRSIWNERYDRELQNIFELQDELARNIANALRITLSTQEETALASRPTGNPQAYDYYLRGRSYLRKKTNVDVAKAYEMFQRAVAIEPEFGLAYAYLAFACVMTYVWYEHEEVWYEQMIEYADRAKSLDPRIPETLVAQAMLLMGKGDYDKSIQLARQAIAIDPQCDGAYWILGLSLFSSDRLKEAMEVASQAVEAAGDDYNVYVPYIHALQKLGRDDHKSELEFKWRQVLIRQLERVPDDGRARMLLAGHYASSGQPAEAVREAGIAIRSHADDNRILYNAACTFALLNMKSEAIQHLKAALEMGYPFFDWMKRDPDLKSLENDPEFQKLFA